jgi:NAD(P)H-quinone oxidoreductase subunit 4
MLLSSLLLVPFLGTLAVLVWPASPSPQRLRLIAIAILSLQLLLSLVALGRFDGCPASASITASALTASRCRWC